MKKFKTKIEGFGQKEYTFLCYENTEPINMGDKYIFFWGGIAAIQLCDSESIMLEINPNDRPKKHDVIDLVYGFWKCCYKIKSTTFNLNLID